MKKPSRIEVAAALGIAGIIGASGGIIKKSLDHGPNKKHELKAGHDDAQEKEEDWQRTQKTVSDADLKKDEASPEPTSDTTGEATPMTDQPGREYVEITGIGGMKKRVDAQQYIDAQQQIQDRRLRDKLLKEQAEKFEKILRGKIPNVTRVVEDYMGYERFYIFTNLDKENELDNFMVTMVDGKENYVFRSEVHTTLDSLAASIQKVISEGKK